MSVYLSTFVCLCSGNSTDGPDISVLAAIGSECESDGQSTSAAELQIQFDTIKEEKRLLEEKLERQTVCGRV